MNKVWVDSTIKPPQKQAFLLGISTRIKNVSGTDKRLFFTLAVMGARGSVVG
jgi:hypothetical protein